MSGTLLSSNPPPPSLSAGQSSAGRWSGRILTGIVVLFLSFDVASKLAGVK